MPRETKASRLERQAQEAAGLQEELRQSWPSRLMNLLERSQAVGLDLRVQNGCFNFVGFGYGSSHIEIEYSYSVEGLQNLDRLECMVQQREEEIREQQRQLAVRTAALAKLTAEERELLNL